MFDWKRLTLRNKQGSAPAFLQLLHDCPLPGSPLQRIFLLRHLPHCRMCHSVSDHARISASSEPNPLTATAMRFLGGLVKSCSNEPSGIA